ASPLDGQSPHIFDELGRTPVSFREEEHPIFLPSYRGEVGVTKAGSRFNERLQHRLEIEGRAADDLKHVGGGRLLLDGLAQRVRPRLPLLEQSRVLDGDHGLIGKSLEQSNLSLREELHFAAAECDCANRDTFSHHGHAKYRAETPVSCVFAALGKFGVFGLQVGNMEGSPIENRSARDGPADQGEGLRRDRTMMGDEEKPGAVRTPNGRVVGAAQLPRGLDQRFQHRLQIEGGATEDLEHVSGGRLLFQRDGKLGSAFADHLFKLLGRLFALDQQPIKRDRIVAKYFDSAAHLGDLVMAAYRNRDVATSTYNGAHSSRKRGDSCNNIPPDIEPDNKDRTDEAENSNRQQRDIAYLLDGLRLIGSRRDSAFRIGD